MPTPPVLAEAPSGKLGLRRECREAHRAGSDSGRVRRGFEARLNTQDGFALEKHDSSLLQHPWHEHRLRQSKSSIM